MSWKYERTERNFGKIPEGKHRIRIENAEMTRSKSGNDMIKLTLSVSGQSRTLWDYIVFMDAHPEITNAKFTQIYDAFGIEEGNFDTSTWIGKVGACVVKIDEQEYEKVNYYIKADKATTLPPWVEPTGGDSPVRGGGEGYAKYDDDIVIPF